MQVGDAVEVFVIIKKTSSRTHPSAIDLLDELPGQRLFKTPEEADQYLQEKRSAWEGELTIPIAVPCEPCLVHIGITQQHHRHEGEDL